MYLVNREMDDLLSLNNINNNDDKIGILLLFVCIEEMS